MNEYIFTCLNKCIVINAEKLSEALLIAEERLQPKGYGCWQATHHSQNTKTFKWMLGNFDE